MDFIKRFAGGSHEQQGYPNQQQSNMGGGQQPPQPPYPWVARWDDRDRRWFFLNEQTGERSWEFPRGGPPPQQGYGQQGGYGGPPQQGYGGPQQGYGGPQGGYGGPPPQQGGYYNGPPQQPYGGQQQQQQTHQKQGHSGLMYGALGAAAGIAGGAFLMHEGSEIKDDFERDKYRVEERADRIGDDVADFPEDAARWTGRKVQEVEDIPQDIEGSFDRFGDRVERKWDDAKDDVEDAPEDAARWAGEKVGDVERFGDNVDDAYDEGRDEARYDDDDRY